ncbi:MAG: glycosyltransferase, partial [Micrococcales bacterium]|nr:glycosyltransferase [Micrococcales bacterium]
YVPAGPFDRLDKEDVPGVLCGMTAGVLRTQAARDPGWYQVVHSHYWLSGQVGAVAARRWDVPLVHTAHTLARVKNRALAPGDRAEPAAREQGEEQLALTADALVASTSAEAYELVDLYGADPQRVHVVAPGVDLERFRPGGPRARVEARAALGLPQHRSVVLFAGRLQPLKAPDVLVRALGVLQATGRPVPLLVVLGGPSGRPTAVRDLWALAKSLGVAGSLVVHPPEAHTDLVRWYHAADVVAVPSRTESFGLVAAEAQASGTPVVAAAVGGLRTIVDDGVSGRLVPGHDPARWADVIAEALADERARASWAAAARRTAERFGWDAAAGQMLAVYAAAAESRRGD